MNDAMNGIPQSMPDNLPWVGPTIAKETVRTSM